MLVLSRKRNESIVLPGLGIEILVIEVRGDKVKIGIESELAKKIVKMIKDSKLKVQAAIQGDAVRVTGAKRDDLQAAMQLLRKDVPDTPLEFNNFRD